MTPIGPPRLLDMSANVPHQSARDFMGIPPAAPPVPRRALANQYEDAVAAVQRENPQQPSQVQMDQDVLGKAQGLMDDINTQAELSETPAPPGMVGDFTGMQPPKAPEMMPEGDWNDLNYPNLSGRWASQAVLDKVHAQYIAAQSAQREMYKLQLKEYDAKLATAQFVAEGKPKVMSEFERGSLALDTRDADLEREKFEYKQTERQPNRTAAEFFIQKADDGELTTKDVAKYIAMTKARGPRTRAEQAQTLTIAYASLLRSYPEADDPVMATLAARIKDLSTPGIGTAGGVMPQTIQGIVNMMGSGGISRAAGAKLFELLGVSPEDIVSGNKNVPTLPNNRRFP